MRDLSESAANLIIVNASIWTPGWSKPRKAAIAIGGGRILRVGSNDQCESRAGRMTKIIDGDRRLVIPGFVDAHAHLLHTGPRMDWLQLQKIRSKNQLLGIVATEARRVRRSGWVLGRGWDESKWLEPSYPTRNELDKVAGKRPVLLRRVDGHMSVASTAALDSLKVSHNTPGLDKDRRGKPTGILRKKANELAGKRLKPSIAELMAAFPKMQRLAYRLGITSVHDVVDERDFAAYLALSRGENLCLRICMMPLFNLLPGLIEGKTTPGSLNEWLKIGPLKIFSDGSIGARTAALHDPYSDEKGKKGALEHAPSELKRIVKRAHRAGFQLAVHAIGDRAIDVTIDAIESALEGQPRQDHRHRIEHYELPSDTAIERSKMLEIIPVMQPNFVVTWSRIGGLYEERLGTVRAERNNPHRLIQRNRLRIAFGSDGMPYGPIHGLQGAVNPPYINQRIPLTKALEAYTLGGAYASFEENLKGSLSPGMLADLAVIDGSWDSEDLLHWKVAATIVGGTMVYKTSAMKSS